MANGNGNGFKSWAIQLIVFLVTIVAVAVAAPIWIEARIEDSVRTEAAERKEADKAIEARREKSLERIEKKLDAIEQYIRSQ